MMKFTVKEEKCKFLIKGQKYFVNAILNNVAKNIAKINVPRKEEKLHKKKIQQKNIE